MKKKESQKVLDVINDITKIHNDLVNGNLFSAGFELGSLQTRLFFLMNDLEEKEKIEDSQNLVLRS